MREGAKLSKKGELGVSQKKKGEGVSFGG